MGGRYAVTMQLKTLRQLFLIYGDVRCHGSAGRRTIADGRGLVLARDGLTCIRAQGSQFRSWSNQRPQRRFAHWRRWLGVESRC